MATFLQNAKAVLILALATSGCGGEKAPTGDGPGTPSVSYYADVKPILDARCVSCHQPGQIGVGDLTSYEGAAAQASLIVEQTETGLMPPWFAGEGCNEYQHDPSLSDAQKETLRVWSDAGAPMGRAG